MLGKQVGTFMLHHPVRIDMSIFTHCFLSGRPLPFRCREFDNSWPLPGHKEVWELVLPLEGGIIATGPLMEAVCTGPYVVAYILAEEFSSTEVTKLAIELREEVKKNR